MVVSRALWKWRSSARTNKDSTTCVYTFRRKSKEDNKEEEGETDRQTDTVPSVVRQANIDQSHEKYAFDGLSLFFVISCLV